MARALTAEFRETLAAGMVRPRFLLELQTAGSTLRYWTGEADHQWDSQTWIASPVFRGVGQIRTTTDDPPGMTLDLTGEPAEIVALAQSGFKAHNIGRLFLGFLAEYEAIVHEPSLLFRGRLDSAELVDDREQSTLRLSYTNDSTSYYDANEFRYTHETQQLFFPGDLGFEYMAQMEDTKLYWGVPPKRKRKRKKNQRGAKR